MKVLRMLLAALAASAGLVLVTQVPAAACSCAATPLARQVAETPVIFLGTLDSVDEPERGEIVSSADPTYYSFSVEETLKGEPGDAVVESAADGGSCGLEGMKVDQTYAVFAYPEQEGLGAHLCGATAPADPAYVARIRAALEPGAAAPVPTEVPSGLDPAATERAPGWVWFAGGVGLALVGGGLAVRLRWVRP